MSLKSNNPRPMYAPPPPPPPETLMLSMLRFLADDEASYLQEGTDARARRGADLFASSVLRSVLSRFTFRFFT